MLIVDLKNENPTYNKNRTLVLST